ncbi:MAG: serine/threonine protein kinase [Puniceicoccales bacterium]|jgi:hypothetical protein|nr:serine/threonine protein kinase [Puniceicoccales bacterium]
MTNEVEFPFGSRIGDYEIMTKLGQGGMGVVYLAQHVFLKKRFALKILSADLALVPEFVQIFQNEAQTLAALKHPSIVEVHNFGMHEGHYYFVMDYLAGGTLESYRIHAGGHLQANELLHSLRAIVGGLKHAHARGIVHRDLKPENFLLDHDGNVKISDFGLARLARSRSGAMQTPEGGRRDNHTFVHLANGAGGALEVAGGTEGYLAPEILEGKAADTRSDIYALGVAAWHLLTGTAPAPMTTPSRLVPGLDPRWDKVLSLCLRPNPRDRYQSVDELDADLEALSGVAQRKFPSWIWAVLVPFLSLVCAGGYFLATVFATPAAPTPTAETQTVLSVHTFRMEDARLDPQLSIEGAPAAIFGWQPDNSARWRRAKPLRPGTYIATILYSSSPYKSKPPVVISLGGGYEPVRATLPPTPDWEETNRVRLGMLRIGPEAEIVFHLESAPTNEIEALVLRGLVLESGEEKEVAPPPEREKEEDAETDMEDPTPDDSTEPAPESMAEKESEARGEE